MWDHLASQFDGATFVHGGDVGDDVVLGRLDRRFSCIGVVVVSFHVLSHGVRHLQEVRDGAGAFIVEYVELGVGDDCLQVCVDADERLHHAVVLLGFYRAEENSVKFINVSDTDVYYAFVRPNWELSRSL